nr:reverse transcriptase domain-containing protein [Tanacetum cinerariifolium]
SHDTCLLIDCMSKLGYLEGTRRIDCHRHQNSKNLGRQGLRHCRKYQIAKLTHAVNQQTSVVTTVMTAILKQFQATPPPASVKAIEEICVTCGGAHPYYQCLSADGNTFLEFWDNIQGYVLAAAVNYNHGPLPSNNIANPKGELKAITTQSGIVLDEPSVPMPLPFINPEEDDHVEETLTDQDLAEYTINFPPPLFQRTKPPSQRNYVKMLKALFSNKEKLLEQANTPLNENCSAVILKKLPKKLGDLGKFLIPCGFSELKCKALADLGASINLMPLSVWKNLGLPELISTRMTLKLANRAICTPTGIAKDVFVPVGKFTFPADFVIVDYESDPQVPLILGRPFLRTAHALIDVHGEEMILRDGDERLILNMRHDPSSYSNQPQKESSNMIYIYNDSCEDYLKDLFATNHLSGNPTFSSHSDLTSSKVKVDIFDSEGDIEKDSILEDSIDEDNFADPNDNLFDTIPEMFTDEHTLDYSSPPIYDEYDDLFELESETNNAYNDPFDSKGEKIKEFKLLIDELDLPRSSDFLPSLEYDSFLFEDFSKVDALPSTNNEDKDFNPPLSDHELPFHKEVLGSETLLLFSSENEEKVFKPEILTSKGVHTSLLLELFHQGLKAFKVIKIFESPMEIFPCSYGEEIYIFDVSCLHFYPS